MSALQHIHMYEFSRSSLYIGVGGIGKYLITVYKIKIL